MRCQGLGPKGAPWVNVAGRDPGIDQHIAIRIPPYERTPAEHVVDRRPPVRVNGSGLSRFNPRIQYAHAFILQQRLMLSRRGDERIEVGRPEGGRHFAGRF